MRKLQNTEKETFFNYFTVPQKYGAFAYVDNRIPVPRGKVLGGTSTVNQMVYMRGLKDDYDDWEYIYGANGWSFDDVLPFFLKSENNTDQNIVSQNFEYHSIDGLLTVSTINDIPEIKKK